MYWCVLFLVSSLLLSAAVRCCWLFFSKNAMLGCWVLPPRMYLFLSVEGDLVPPQQHREVTTLLVVEGAQSCCCCCRWMAMYLLLPALSCAPTLSPSPLCRSKPVGSDFDVAVLFQTGKLSTWLLWPRTMNSTLLYEVLTRTERVAQRALV